MSGGLLHSRNEIPPHIVEMIRKSQEGRPRWNIRVPTVYTLPGDLAQKVSQIREETKNHPTPQRECGYEIFDYLSMRVKYDDDLADVIHANNDLRTKLIHDEITDEEFLQAKSTDKHPVPLKAWERKKAVCLGLGLLYTSCLKYAGIESYVVKVDVDEKNLLVSHACSVARFETGEQLVDLAYYSFEIDHKKWYKMSQGELNSHCESPTHTWMMMTNREAFKYAKKIRAREYSEYLQKEKERAQLSWYKRMLTN